MTSLMPPRSNNSAKDGSFRSYVNSGFANKLAGVAQIRIPAARMLFMVVIRIIGFR
jgi:hypothetical protein